MLRRAPVILPVPATNGNGTYETNGTTVAHPLGTNGHAPLNGKTLKPAKKKDTLLNGFKALIDTHVNWILEQLNQNPARVQLSKAPRELQIRVDSPAQVKTVERVLQGMALQNTGIHRAERDQWGFLFSNPGIHGPKPFRVGILPVLGKTAATMLEQHLAKIPTGLYENAGNALANTLQAVGKTLQKPVNGVRVVNPRHVAFYQQQRDLPSDFKLLREKRLPIALPANTDFPVVPDYVVPPNDVELLPATPAEAADLKALLTTLQDPATGQAHTDILNQHHVTGIALNRPERFAYQNHAISVIPKAD